MHSGTNQNAEKLAGVLRETIQYLESSQQSGWTNWTPQRVIEVLKREACALETTGRPDDAPGLHAHYLATASIQETAMENGWTDAYMSLAAQVDRLIAAYTSS